MFVISFHTIIYNSYSGVWRNSVREFGAVPFGSLAAKLTILSVFYCIPYVLLFFFKALPVSTQLFGVTPKVFREVSSRRVAGWHAMMNDVHIRH